jgi:hypothetical protein
MVENTDDLMLLLLRCDGKQAAITTYEEETGASHAEAVQAVERIARNRGIAGTRWPVWRTGMIIVVTLTASVLFLLFVVSS